MKEGMQEEDRKPEMDRAGLARVVQNHHAPGEEHPNLHLMQMASQSQATAPVLSQLTNLSLSLKPYNKGKLSLDLNAEPIEEEDPMTYLSCQDEKPCIIPGRSSLAFAIEPYPTNKAALSTTSFNLYQYSDPPTSPRT